jgi:hypothetical protein
VAVKLEQRLKPTTQQKNIIRRDPRMAFGAEVVRKQKVRITLDLSPEFYERLSRLETLVQADSKSSLIRRALQVFEFVAEKSRDGVTFKSVDPDGSQEKELVFLNPYVFSPDNGELR